MNEWLSLLIAAAALFISGFTFFRHERRRRFEERRADVRVWFHWLTDLAAIRVGDREVQVGYHLVLANEGPSEAREISIDVRDDKGQQLTLLDVGEGELPLKFLAAGGRYPIPWLYEPFERHARRFEVTVTWTDNNGRYTREVPLRRGQVPRS